MQIRIREILGRIRSQILGSVPRSNGSGTGSGSCTFASDLQDANKKLFLSSFAYYFLKVHLHHSSQIKRHEKSQNSRNQGLSYWCCLMRESGSGSVPQSNGSGSGRPKNLRVLNTVIFYAQREISFLVWLIFSLNLGVDPDQEKRSGSSGTGSASRHHCEIPLLYGFTCVVKVHERLGKLVTVRSRPQAIKLVKPSELASVQQLIHTLAKVCQCILFSVVFTPTTPSHGPSCHLTTFD